MKLIVSLETFLSYFNPYSKGKGYELLKDNEELMIFVRENKSKSDSSFLIREYCIFKNVEILKFNLIIFFKGKTFMNSVQYSLEHSLLCLESRMSPNYFTNLEQECFYPLIRNINPEFQELV